MVSMYENFKKLNPHYARVLYTRANKMKSSIDKDRYNNFLNNIKDNRLISLGINIDEFLNNLKNKTLINFRRN